MLISVKIKLQENYFVKAYSDLGAPESDPNYFMFKSVTKK